MVALIVEEQRQSNVIGFDLQYAEHTGYCSFRKLSNLSCVELLEINFVSKTMKHFVVCHSEPIIDCSLVISWLSDILTV